MGFLSGGFYLNIGMVMTTEENIIKNDDCIHFLSLLEDESIDLTVIDIPYFQSDNRTFTFKKKNGKKKRKSYELNMGKWDVFSSKKEYLKWVKELLVEIRRVLKMQSSLYLFSNYEYLSDIRQLMETNGYSCKIPIPLCLEPPVYFENPLVWMKRNPFQNIQHIDYTSGCELIIHAIKIDPDDPKTTPRVFNWYKQQEIIFPQSKFPDEPKWEVNMHNYVVSPICMPPERIRDEDGQTVHKTQKPIESLLKPILTSSKEGEVVMDCCCGMGSTLETAKLLGRKYLGCEIDKNYYGFARRRLDGDLPNYSISKRLDYLIKRLRQIGSKESAGISKWFG